MGILRQLKVEGYPHSLRLIYGNRVKTQILYRDEIDALSQSLDFQVHHVLSEPPPGWTGLTGDLTPDVLARCLDPLKGDGWFYFVCGPPVMNQRRGARPARPRRPLKPHHRGAVQVRLGAPRLRSADAQARARKAAARRHREGMGRCAVKRYPDALEHFAVQGRHQAALLSAALSFASASLESDVFSTRGL
jgi:hypothetical protein